MVTISDVAAHAGTSRTSVSYALTRPGRLSAELLARVQASIDELGFVRNDVAHRLRAGRSLVVALIVPNAAHPVYTEIASAVEAAASSHGMFTLVASSNDDPKRERDYIRFFLAQDVSAILIAPVAEVPELLDEEEDTPIVVIGPATAPHRFASVSGNDRKGGALAATHLLEQGRKRLLFVGGEHENVRSRLDGVREVVDARDGASVDVITVAQQGFVEGESVGEQISLDGSVSYDGIIAGNDRLGLGLLHALTRAGIAIPGQVALVGYDDIEYSRHAILPMSSVRHPLAEFGSEAVSLALAADDGESRQRIFEPELVVRSSSSST